MGIAAKYCLALVTAPDSKKLGTLLAEDVSYSLTINDGKSFTTSGKDKLIEAFKVNFYKVDNNINIEELSFQPKSLSKKEGKHKIDVNLKVTKTHDQKWVEWSDQMTLTIKKVEDLYFITKIKARVKSSPLKKMI